MVLAVGDSTATKAYVGDQPVNRIYQGDSLVADFTDPGEDLTALPIYDEFSDVPDGSLPATTETGQTWRLFSGPGEVNGGYFDSVPGTGASYLDIDAPLQPVDRVGARWRFNDQGGTLGPSSGTLALVTWNDGGLLEFGYMPATSGHITIEAGFVQWYVNETSTVSGPLTVIDTQTISPALAPNVDHVADVRWGEGTGTVTIDGTDYVFTDPRISPQPGERVINWEPFYNSDGVNTRCEIAEIWADGVPYVPATPALTGEAYTKSEVETLTADVTVPATAAEGDTLILVAQFLSSTATPLSAPAGWTELDQHSRSAFSAAIWTKTATLADIGSPVTVTSPTAKVHNLACWSLSDVSAISVTAAADQDPGLANFTVPAHSPAVGTIPAHILCTASSTIDDPQTWTGVPSGMEVKADNLPVTGERQGLTLAAPPDWGDNATVGNVWTANDTTHFGITFLLSLTPSGGGGDQGGDPTPSAGLFFEQSDPTLNDQLVFAHHFSPFALSYNNSTSPDYYESGYLAIDGESGIHASYGGFIRDRPLKPTAPWPTSPDYRTNMYVQDIDYAIKYGINGFVVDLISTSGNNRVYGDAVFDAADLHYPGTFWVVPMLDAGGSVASQGVAYVANYFNGLLNKSCALIRAGKYVVASYRPELVAGLGTAASIAWWNDFVTEMSTVHGKTVELWHVFLDIGQAPAFRADAGQNAAMAATGIWGPGADPAAIAGSSSSWATAAQSAGHEVFHPCWPQDIRPSNSHGRWFDEALNSECIRAYWARIRAIGAEKVQLTTWNDYSEGSSWQPSAMHGEALLAINAYHQEWWRTGSPPDILVDGVIVSHRNQMLTSTITGGQTQFMVQNTARVAESPLREQVEILTYLPTSDTVTVNIGASQYQYVAPAGEHAQLYPMEFGQVSVSTGRGVNLVSPVEIREYTGNQDRGYAYAYNLATMAGQHDPTPPGQEPLAGWDITATPGDQQVLVEWPEYAGATGYRVGHDQGAGWEIIDPPETRSRLLTFLTNGVPVTVHVQPMPDGPTVTKTVTPTA